MSKKSSPPNPILTFLALAAVVFGIPSASVVALSRFVALNPWLTAVLIVIYELFVIIIAFTSKVWQQLEESWTRQVAGGIKGRVEEQFSNYESQYFQYLIYLHRDFDIRGLNTQSIFTLKLEQIFVDLRMIPTAIYQASGNLVRVKKLTSLQTKNHSIWDYLMAQTLADQHFVILGPPGSGKTTLLKHVVLALCTQTNSSAHIIIPYNLPVLLFLRDYVQTIKDQPNFSLINAIRMQMESMTTWVLPASWIESQLKKGHCLLLLDGLDEVADFSMRKMVVEWVQKQMIAYGNNRFIVTSRPLGYKDNPLSGVAVLEVQPFTPDQIEQFLDNWYIANEIMSAQQDDQGVRMKAKVGAKDLLQRMQKAPALLTLAVNPLLLTMIATVHRYRSSLPGRRVELYGEMCEVLLSKRQEVKGIPQQLSAKQKLRVLQVLAYNMMLRGNREISRSDIYDVIKAPLGMVSSQLQPETFLRQIEEVSGLLLEQEHDRFGFAHLTFQEFLAATYLHENNNYEILVSQINEEWWHETIRLYCAQADTTPILQACFAKGHPTAKLLTLALECREEALEVQPKVSEQLDDFLEQSIEASDPELRRVVAEALLTRRIR